MIPYPGSKESDDIFGNVKVLPFKFLKNKELDLIKQNSYEVTFKAGETIKKERAPLTHVITLRSGLCKLYLEGLNNRNVILRIIKPGDFVGGPGIYTDLLHHYTVTALMNSTALFIDVKIIKQIIHTNIEFAEEFIKLMSIKLLSTYGRLINLTQKQMPGRVAGALIYLTDEVFETRKFDMILSKQDLAYLTSMSKDNVVRVLKAFTKEGLINLTNENIKIIDYDSLLRISKLG